MLPGPALLEGDVNEAFAALCAIDVAAVEGGPPSRTVAGVGAMFAAGEDTFDLMRCHEGRFEERRSIRWVKAPSWAHRCSLLESFLCILGTIEGLLKILLGGDNDAFCLTSSQGAQGRVAAGSKVKTGKHARYPSPA